MRKHVTGASPKPQTADGTDWLDLARIAEVGLTSEAPGHAIEAALVPGSGSGWRAAEPGIQAIRLTFDAPQRVRRIELHFVECDTARTQEIVLRWSGDSGRSFREIVRQQWNFSPTGATSESEDYQVDLLDVTELELVIEPDMSGGAAHASLDSLRVA